MPGLVPVVLPLSVAPRCGADTSLHLTISSATRSRFFLAGEGGRPREGQASVWGGRCGPVGCRAARGGELLLLLGSGFGMNIPVW